jgi:hypothetical protein
MRLFRSIVALLPLAGAFVAAAPLAAPLAARLAAQATQGPPLTAPPTTTPLRIPYISYVAIDPLGIPFDIGSVEFETGVAPALTIGGAGSYTELGDRTYSSADFKVRYYPEGVVLRGLGVGGSLGVTHFAYTAGEPRQTLNAPTAGVVVDYNWLLGTQQRFLVGTGVAAKRILAGSADRDRVDVDRAYASARFVIGLAF